MLITTSEQLVEKSPSRPPFPWRPTPGSLGGKTPRVLGIDPGTRLMGIAVLEGDDLIYYAVKELRRMRPGLRFMQATRDAVSDVIERFHPDTLAYETSYYIQQAASPLLGRQEREIRRVGKAAGLKVVAYSPLYVRQQLCADAYVTKHMVAQVLVQRFPELVGYRLNQTPRSERYWLNMFDALAVAVVASREFRRDANASDDERTARAA
jgi:Holliday junction resolvasome RuvABC endonuclease subunit